MVIWNHYIYTQILRLKHVHKSKANIRFKSTKSI